MKTCKSLRRLAGIAFVFATAINVNTGLTLAQPRVAEPLQNPTPPASGMVTVDTPQARMEMIISSSQILKVDGDIARANVHNDALVDVKPISRDQMLVSAKATGFTQVDLYGSDGSVRNVQITILADARELASILRSEFPSSTISVRPIQNAVILSGSVTSDVHVAAAVQIAQQYYPNVINRIEVLGVHTVQLHVQIMEVSRTKLRNAGVDWALGFGDDFVQQTASGLLNPGGSTGAVFPAGNETFKFGVVDGGNSFFAYLNLLKRDNLVKVLADPTLTAVDGRPASFNSGGEFPVLVPAGLGQVGVEFREFGTRLDFVAKVRGDGMIHLEVRPMISEVDESRSVAINGISVPGLRSRYVETGVDMHAGQTLALAGLLQVRTEASVNGIPGLADLPYLGFMFRNVREVQNEVELLITVTPDFAAGMDPTELPTSYPGFNTTSPSDKELYWKGHIEVPNVCNENGQQCEPGLQSFPIVTPNANNSSQQYFPPDVSQQNFSAVRPQPARSNNGHFRNEGMLPAPNSEIQQASYYQATR
jgi:pilus assembly protein CpaC